MLKKMDRDAQIHNAVELKQNKIRDVQYKLDSMNENISKVLKQKEDQLREKKAREDFDKEQKLFGKSKLNELKDKDTERLLEKMREKDERYKKLKMEKEDYSKFYSGLKKDLTVKKHGLEDEVAKKYKIT